MSTRMRPRSGNAQSSRRRRNRHSDPYRAEHLESRLLLVGNLHLVDAYLTDSSGNELTTVAAGEVVYIQVEFQTTGLAAGAKYHIETTLGGTTYGGPELDWGAGVAGTSNWVFRWGTFLTDSGTNSASAQLDSQGQIAETNETAADNTKNFAKTGLVHSPEFVKPIEGNMGSEWAFVNYTDTDRVDGTCHDPYGGPYCYDGHNGWDWSLPNFHAMDAGVDVYAAAAGTVTKVVDTNFDREMAGNSNPANYITVDHGGGWTTQYFHIRKYSAIVNEGDTVTAGQKIALVGSAGNSTDAHLHWGVYYQGRLVDPGVAPNEYLAFSQPYPDVLPGVIDGGITDAAPTGTEMKERPARYDYFQQVGGDTVWYWMRLTGTEAGDNLTVRWYQPGGAQFASSTWDPGLIRYGSWNATLGLPLIAPTGTWQVASFINGAEKDRQSFYVQGTLEPEVEMQYAGAYFVDGRTTPFDLGTITQAQGVQPTRTFTVRNVGLANLTTSGLGVPTGFTVTEGLDATIAPGGSDTFTVRLDDDVAGHKIGFVSFSTNDPSSGELVQSFRIEGTVTSTSDYINARMDDGIDTVYIRRSGSNAQIWVNTSTANPATLTTPVSAMANFVLNTLGGDDTLTVDYLNGVPFPGSMTYNGGAGTDELDIFGENDAASGDAFFFDIGKAWLGFSGIDYTSVFDFVANGRAGDDIFTLGSTGSTADLNSLGTNFTITGSTGDDTLTLNDQEDLGNDTYTLTNSTFTKSSFGTLSYSSMATVVLNANPDNDTINVNSSFSGTDLTINCGAGDDEVTLGTGNLSSLDGHVTVNGAVGTDTVTLDNHSNAVVGETTITPTALLNSNFAGLTYGTLEHLTYDAESVGTLITVNSTAAATPVLIEPNGGTDSIAVMETSASAPVTIAPSAGDDTVRVNTDNTGAARVLFDQSIKLGVLGFGTGGLATLTAGGNKVLEADAIGFSGGRLDLTNNRAIVHANPAQSASVRNNLEAQAGLGRNPDPVTGQGRWNGANGIISSSAALGNLLEGIELYGVVVIRDGDVSDLAGLTPQASFGGVPVGPDDILIRYSYAGDATANGLVDGDDYTLIDLGYAIADNRYVAGDFTFDNVIDGDDYTIIDLNYAVTGGGMPLAAGTSPTPIPAAQPSPFALGPTTEESEPGLLDSTADAEILASA